jgi:hypothetical protein
MTVTSDSKAIAARRHACGFETAYALIGFGPMLHVLCRVADARANEANKQEAKHAMRCDAGCWLSGRHHYPLLSHRLTARTARIMFFAKVLAGWKNIRDPLTVYVNTCSGSFMKASIELIRTHFGVVIAYKKGTCVSREF